MAKKPTSNKNAGGLHSKKDPRQDDLRDERQGAYDPVGNQKVPDTNHQTKHERAQTGATFVASLYPTENFELPEGLKRPRMDRTIVTEGGTTFRIRCPAPRGTVDSFKSLDERSYDRTRAHRSRMLRRVGLKPLRGGILPTVRRVTERDASRLNV